MRVSSGSGRGGGRQRRPRRSRGVAVTRAAASEPGLPARPEAPRRAAARRNGGWAGEIVGVGHRGRSGAGRPSLSHPAGQARPGPGLAGPGPGYALGKSRTHRGLWRRPRRLTRHPSLPLGPGGSAWPGRLRAAGLVLSGIPGTHCCDGAGHDYWVTVVPRAPFSLGAWPSRRAGMRCAFPKERSPGASASSPQWSWALCGGLGASPGPAGARALTPKVTGHRARRTESGPETLRPLFLNPAWPCEPPLSVTCALCYTGDD